MKIFYWASSMVDGTFHYRLHLPGEALKARGHGVRIATMITEQDGRWADIIVGQRISNPRNAIGWKEMAASGLWKMVYEVDDNLLAIDPRTNDLAAVGQFREQAVNAARAIGAQAADDAAAGRAPHLGAMRSVRLNSPMPVTGPLELPQLERTDPGRVQPFRDFRSPDVQRAMRECIAAADLVTVTVPQLAEALRPYNPNAVVLPNSVPATLLDMPPQRELLAGRVILGWQGSSTHTDDWLVAADAIREVVRERPYETHMRFVGTAHPGGFRPNQVSFLQWTTDLRKHYERVSRFHIGLAPLRDTVFNKSKSPLRAVEMHALGVPGVYSRVPAYEAVVEHGVTGFLAGSTDEWRTYLRRLVDSPGLRAGMGDAAREAARAWTIERRVELWERAYEGLLS